MAHSLSQTTPFLCLPKSLNCSSRSCRSSHFFLAFSKLAPAQLWKVTSRHPSWRCESGPTEKTSTPLSDADAEPQSSDVAEDCCNSNSTESTNAVNYLEAPTKNTNRLIALASAAGAIGLFLASRGGLTGATLGELAAAALPYEEALSNGRPTVLEFYADWCEVCKQMAPDVYKVEQKYKDMVNFVMLNVDNTKWDQELDEFGVEGIPHFAFLDKEGNEEGNIVGKLPKKYLEDNVIALSKGEEKLPHSRVVGQFSNPELHQVPRMAGPRSHGAM